MVRAARASLLRARKLNGKIETEFNESKATTTTTTERKFNDRWRKRAGADLLKFQKTLAETVIAAFIGNEEIGVSSKDDSFKLRLVRVPSQETARGLIFKVFDWQSADTKGDLIVYADANEDGTEATLVVPRFGTVHLEIPDDPVTESVGVTCDV